MEDIPEVEHCECIDDPNDNDYDFSDDELIDIDEDDFNNYKVDINSAENYLLDPKYIQVLKLKYKLRKMTDDLKALKFLEKQMKKFKSLNKIGLPRYNDLEVYNKFNEVAECEYKSIINKMSKTIDTENGANVDIYTNDESKSKKYYSSITWESDDIGLVELFYSLHWSENRKYSKNLVKKEFKDFSEFFHHPVEGDITKIQQYTTVKNLQRIKKMHKDFKKILKSRNYTFEDNEIINFTNFPPVGYTLESSIEWKTSHVGFVQMFTVLKMTKSFSSKGNIDPFWQFCEFFNVTIVDPQSILKELLETYRNQEINFCLVKQIDR